MKRERNHAFSFNVSDLLRLEKKKNGSYKLKIIILLEHSEVFMFYDTVKSLFTVLLRNFYVSNDFEIK